MLKSIESGIADIFDVERVQRRRWDFRQAEVLEDVRVGPSDLQPDGPVASVDIVCIEAVDVAKEPRVCRFRSQ